MAYISTTGQSFSTQAAAAASMPGRFTPGSGSAGKSPATQAAYAAQMALTPAGGGATESSSGIMDFKSAQDMFAPATAVSPFDESLAATRAAQAAARGRIRGQFGELKEEEEATGKFRTAGAEALGARFTGRGLSTFMKGMVDKEIDRSEKALAKLEKYEAEAIANLDADFAGKIADLKYKELIRQDTLRQQSVTNAFQLMNTQMSMEQMTPEYRRFNSLLNDPLAVRAGVTPEDSPEEIQRKLDAAPRTEEERLQIQLLKAKISEAYSSTQPGQSGDAAAFYATAFSQGISPTGIAGLPDSGFSERFGNLVDQDNRLNFVQNYSNWAVQQTIETIKNARESEDLPEGMTADDAGNAALNAIIERNSWIGDLLPAEYNSYY